MSKLERGVAEDPYMAYLVVTNLGDLTCSLWGAQVACQQSSIVAAGDTSLVSCTVYNLYTDRSSGSCRENSLSGSSSLQVRTVLLALIFSTKDAFFRPFRCPGPPHKNSNELFVLLGECGRHSWQAKGHLSAFFGRFRPIFADFWPVSAIFGLFLVWACSLQALELTRSASKEPHPPQPSWLPCQCYVIATVIVVR